MALALAEWWWRSATYTPPLYYDLFLRVPEFLLGASLAAWGGQRVVSEAQAPLWVSLGVGLLVLAFAGVDEARFSPLAAMLACVGTALVIGARVSQGLWARFFSWPLLVWVGGLSYSLYLGIGPCWLGPGMPWVGSIGRCSVHSCMRRSAWPWPTLLGVGWRTGFGCWGVAHCAPVSSPCSCC